MLLEVRGLSTRFHTDDGVVRAVEDVSFAIGAGETLGIVGESGSGKSVTSLSLMRLLPEHGAEIAAGSVVFLGRDLLRLPERDLPAVRGAELAMIFQEPMTSLNPVLRVGDQVAEAIRAHRGGTWRAALARAAELFREVGIPEPERRIRSYPHELSGGQKQRVMIAMALSCDPKLLIADEPTTALDVTVQAQILDLLRTLRDRRGMSMLFITHDLGVIAEIADRVAVMYRGRIVEHGDVLEVFSAPKHPYTRGLLACRPRPDAGFETLPTVDDFLEVREEGEELALVAREPGPERLAALRRPRARLPAGDAILEVRGLRVRFPTGWDWLGRPRRWLDAVDDVSFTVDRGRTLGLVGESGCGKTTTARAILRLVPATAGSVRFEGRDLLTLGARELRAARRRIQIVFQDPYGSLNPRMSVGEAVGEALEVHGIGGRRDRSSRVAALLEEVGLRPALADRYPHELSGGQRQRICIARALAVEPELLVCDEAVSALDVSVQAQVLNLLKELQERRHLAYLFVSHDLAVVRFMADEIAVMRDGRIVERGPAAAIWEAPREDYTRALLAAIPRDDLDHLRALRSARQIPRPPEPPGDLA